MNFNNALMKTSGLLLFSALFILISSCGSGQTESTKTDLTAVEFSAKIKENPSAPVLDVRTPEEYSKGHIENALNYNWNGDDFDTQISSLDKSKPVFVYCMSGGRSSSAAEHMRSVGFKEVYELQGGIMKWRAASLPETTENTSVSTGMTKPQFDSLLLSDKLVLVDFYADWCAPCKKMKPYLEEIAKEMADKVVVIRINADDNKSLCKELKIDELPVLQLYKAKEMIWDHTGFIEKADVVKQLK